MPVTDAIVSVDVVSIMNCFIVQVHLPEPSAATLGYVPAYAELMNTSVMMSPA